MNISATHLPIQTSIAPPKVAGLPDTPISVTTSVDASSQTPPTQTVSPSNTPVNPTYEKPTASNRLINDSENKTNQTGQEIPSDDRSPGEIASNQETTDQTKPKNQGSFTEVELELISELKLRDAEVNAHEKAHAAVGGQHAGSPSYSYKTGPDGIKYAVSGEVSIDTSKVAGDPQATLQKAQQIKAAALAPAEPSGQDRKVAAKAQQMASEARSDLLNENSEQGGNSGLSHSHQESRVSEHFTGEQSSSMNSHSNVIAQMNERNYHINALYQNSASTTPPASLDLQA